jgi:hypothetical protein
MPGPVSVADVEVAVDRLDSYAHLAGVGELNRVPHEVEEHLGEALLVAEANGQGLRHRGGRLTRRDVELAEPCDGLLFEP